MRYLKTGLKTSSAASAVWHVAPSYWNQILPILSSIFVQHGPIEIAIEPKSAPNSDSFRVRRLFNVCVRVYCSPNGTILLAYIPDKIKMSFICKDDFLPKSASSVRRSLKGIRWSICFNSWTNSTFYGVISRSLCKMRLNDVSETFNYWERQQIHVDGASHTLSAKQAIFPGVRIVFGFSRFHIYTNGLKYIHIVRVI